MEKMNISKFKATCLAVLDRVNRSGKPMIILKRGRPIAQVIPPPLPKKLKTWLGSFRSTGNIVGDIISPVLDENDWEITNK